MAKNQTRFFLEKIYKKLKKACFVLKKKKKALKSA